MLAPFIFSFSFTAMAATIHLEEGDSIQTAMNDASPGDTIILAAGTYAEDLSTETSGSEDAPITVKADEDATVTITAVGEVLQIDHPHWHFDSIVFDGQFGESDTIDINDDAHHTHLRNVVVQNSSRDCIDMGAPSNVRIESSTIHSCLWFDNDEEERRDAHGVTGGAVQDLTIIDTEIHTFSGDAIQFDPGREAPGWNNIVIQGCRLYLEPLAEDLNGFEAGQVTGENAIDTKTNTEADRATLLVEDTEAWGFKTGLDIDNQAAFLIKEGVDATFRRVLVRDSEIGFRVRGPTSTRPVGAHVRLENTLLTDLDAGIRFEDNIEVLTVLYTTFGMGIHNPFVEVGSTATTPEIKNSLFTDTGLPTIASEAQGNRAASEADYVDADARNHRLVETSGAIDAGIPIDGIATDYDNLDRWIGDAPDAGAFEFGQEVIEDTGGPEDTGEPDTADPDDSGDIEPTDTGSPSVPDVPGIGAAESVGEKGGCGCTSQAPFRMGIYWLFAALFVGFRSRSKTKLT